MVSGSGFQPNATVDVYFDKQGEGRTVTNGQGAFYRVAIQVPDSSYSGKHWVTALERDQRIGAHKPFLVYTNWPEYGFDPTLAGANPYENFLNKNNVSQLQPIWIFTLHAGSYSFSTPAIYNGLVYAGFFSGGGGDHNGLYVFDRATGDTDGRTYGWRVGELRKLRVNQVNLLDRTIRLNPGETKNNDGRTVKMTSAVYQLLTLCVAGKQREDFVFTRGGERAIKDFRKAWAKACEKAGVPGLLVHDLRRTAARNLRRAGVAEGVIQKIGGWRTRSVFERYAIVTESDLADAVERLESRDGYSLGIVAPKVEGQEEQVKPN